ncbi:MAG TPA: 2-succinyl-5-enolpyruvyl-6-hydroxy-3-cyclohexene-1-carboxylic-acid synthase [Candidatus Nanopelagicaceae bacterium]|nr:2-succinyl-5-enolpyruvyl-6-hydroxy-3-cyclohexene-1-carboxylic-acid synthase [Candidatus Nanopelagicaceae bacterium]
MNPSTAISRVLVDELIRGGVREVVVSPGSRSAALALAFADAAGDGLVRLHMQIDERSAAFLALGIAKATGLPVPVVCTSGTAAANFHPAVLEASHTDTPLIVLTADRPNELRGTGANQTTNQMNLYGSAVRFFAEVGVPEAQVGQVRYWRSLVSRALASAATGPVHLNLAFREPLLPDDQTDDQPWVESLEGRESGLSWTTVLTGGATVVRDIEDLGITPDMNGVVLIGHAQGGFTSDDITTFTSRLGWPIVAENPLSFASALAHASLFLASPAIRSELRADAVIVIGQLGLSRSLLSYLADAPKVIAVEQKSFWSDPLRRTDIVVDSFPEVSDEFAKASYPDEWLASWHRHADQTARVILSEVSPWSEANLAREFAALLPQGATCFVGSSRPIRDLEAFAVPRGDLEVLANRGLAGIDGNISTAIGIALSRSERTYAIMGDLTFLHDSNGLLCDPTISLTIVAVDNNGGGIFNTLPQRGVEHFELVFGTPHHRNLADIATAFGHSAVEVSNLDEFRAALSNPSPGVQVIVARMPDREANATQIARVLQSLV